jgi:hypothetical protein
MNAKRIARTTAKYVAAATGLAVASYGTYAGMTWLRYGKTRRETGKRADELLDAFMPDYEIVDRRRIYVAAPAEVSLSAATEIDMRSCRMIRGIFKGREWLLRSKPDGVVRPRGFLAETKSLGWGMLAERPGREIVMAAVTKPWEANPVFRSLPPDEFAAFAEPGYVKIIWTLRADPIRSGGASIFRTETRAAATDPESRRRFRRYWAFLSPGIIAIRAVLLPAVKAEAERRWRAIAA